MNTEIVTHWTKGQQERYAELMRNAEQKPEECWLGYWCSDAHGYPVYGSGASQTVRATVGALHQIEAEEPAVCSSSGLHATLDPYRWPGHRVWAVAIHGPRDEEQRKVAGLRREILGEVLPNEALCPRLGARLGRRDLSGAELVGANLRGANLLRANLDGVNLEVGDLEGANLEGASLEGANLEGANLRCIILYGGFMTGAILHAADLRGANLGSAHLHGADLRVADLRGAYLRGAYLRGADLRGTVLRCAELEGGDLTGAARAADDAPIPGWKRDTGKLVRA